MDAWMDAGNCLGMLGRLCRCVGRVGMCVWGCVWTRGDGWTCGISVDTSGCVGTPLDACGRVWTRAERWVDGVCGQRLVVGDASRRCVDAALTRHK